MLDGPVGPTAPAGQGDGPADLAETLRASVEAAKANRAKSSAKAPDEPEEPAKAPKPRRPATPRRKASA